MERKAWRSQPALAMKTTPFRPACQQSPVITSPPKPPRHFHLLSTCESGSPVPSLLSWNQHQPRGPPLHPLRLLHSHLVEPNLCTPPPRAIPGRYPIPGFGSSPTSRPGSAPRARGARPDAPPPGPPARRVAASCAPPLPRRRGVVWTRASAAA